MSNINPSNYPGMNGVLVGYVRGIDYPPYDKQGSRGYKQVSIPIDEGYKKDGEFVKTGTTWYRYEAHQDKIAELGLGVGDKVRLENVKQSVREYGEGKLAITLSFGEVTILEKGNGGQQAPAASSEGDYF